jgi:hypothetical protein
MRDMDPAPHRVWRYTVPAWMILLGAPLLLAVARWQMGVDRDIDMSGVHELVFLFLIAFSAPTAVLAFGVFAPLAVGLDSIAKGRTSRFVNVLLGAALSLPVLVLTVIVAGWPRRGSASYAAVLIAALLLAGMTVGLGLRHRGSTRSTLIRPSAG